jgi:hypothetical protein
VPVLRRAAATVFGSPFESAGRVPHGVSHRRRTRQDGRPPPAGDPGRDGRARGSGCATSRKTKRSYCVRQSICVHRRASAVELLPVDPMRDSRRRQAVTVRSGGLGCTGHRLLTRAALLVSRPLLACAARLRRGVTLATVRRPSDIMTSSLRRGGFVCRSRREPSRITPAASLNRSTPMPPRPALAT